MKLKALLAAMVVALFIIPTYSGASTVFETTGWIIEKQGLVYQFEADVVPPNTYQATITDLSVAPTFGLNDLFLSITTSTEVLAFRFGEGSVLFPVVAGATYFANVFANGAGLQEAGLFGLKIEAVPIPTTLLLFGSGLLGLIAIRRRRR